MTSSFDLQFANVFVFWWASFSWSSAWFVLPEFSMLLGTDCNSFNWSLIIELNVKHTCISIQSTTFLQLHIQVINKFTYKTSLSVVTCVNPRNLKPRNFHFLVSFSFEVIFPSDDIGIKRREIFLHIFWSIWKVCRMMSTYSNAHAKVKKIIFNFAFPRNWFEFGIILNDSLKSSIWDIQILVSFTGTKISKNPGIQPSHYEFELSRPRWGNRRYITCNMFQLKHELVSPSLNLKGSDPTDNFKYVVA